MRPNSTGSGVRQQQIDVEGRINIGLEFRGKVYVQETLPNGDILLRLVKAEPENQTSKHDFYRLMENRAKQVFVAGVSRSVPGNVMYMGFSGNCFDDLG